MQWSLDGTNWTAASSASRTIDVEPGTYTFVWQSTQLDIDRVHMDVRLQFSVRDANDAGNTIVTALFNVDNTSIGTNDAPVVAIHAPLVPILGCETLP